LKTKTSSRGIRARVVRIEKQMIALQAVLREMLNRIGDCEDDLDDLLEDQQGGPGWEV